MTARKVLLYWQQVQGVLVFATGPKLSTGEVLAVQIGNRPTMPYTVMAVYTGPEPIQMLTLYLMLYGPVLAADGIQAVHTGLESVRAAEDCVAYLLKVGQTDVRKFSRN